MAKLGVKFHTINTRKRPQQELTGFFCSATNMPITDEPIHVTFKSETEEGTQMWNELTLTVAEAERLGHALLHRVEGFKLQAQAELARAEKP